MKFIHCADLHLDSSMEGLSTEKSRVRREELLRTFERAVDYAAENGVRAIIIAGDMFDTKRVSSQTRKRLLRYIETHSGIDFLYLSGNHDEDNFLRSLEALPDNLKTFSDSWTQYEYGDTVVSGITITSKNSRVFYDTLKLNKNDKNIVVLHGQIVDYQAAQNPDVISLPRLKNKGVDYLALGHIHSYSTGALDERGVYCYSGCLEGRGFDEVGEKGFVVIDTDDELKYEFVRFAQRIIYTLNVDITNRESWYDARLSILNELNAYPKDCLIKLILTGEIPTDFDLDTDGLELELNEKFFFCKVVNKTRTSINLVDYATDKSIRGEFVRIVMASALSDEIKQAVILKGLNALSDREV